MQYIQSSSKFLTQLQQTGRAWHIHQPEEEEDGSAVADAIYVVIVIHVGFDGINEAWVKLLSLVEDEQRLRAAQHHVPDRLSQLALDTERRERIELQRQKNHIYIFFGQVYYYTEL